MLGNEESGKGDPVKPSDRRSNPAPDASSLNTYCWSYRVPSPSSSA